MWSKFDMIIDYIDNIVVNENPLKSIIIHETSVRVVVFSCRLKKFHALSPSLVKL